LASISSGMPGFKTRTPASRRNLVGCLNMMSLSHHPVCGCDQQVNPSIFLILLSHLECT
jgi:hypothetical protein